MNSSYCLIPHSPLWTSPRQNAFESKGFRSYSHYTHPIILVLIDPSPELVWEFAPPLKVLAGLQPMTRRTQKLQVANTMLLTIERHPRRRVHSVMIVATRDDAIELQTDNSTAQAALPAKNSDQRRASAPRPLFLTSGHGRSRTDRQNQHKKKVRQT